jgi:hypothetical protein
MAADSLFVFPPSSSLPDGLIAIRNCITFCVYFDNFEDEDFKLDSSLQQRLDESALRPRVMFVRVRNPETQSAAAWQKLNNLLVFRSIVVVEFVDRARFQALGARDARILLKKFKEFKHSADALDRALVLKECLWAQENASDHLTTAKDLINSELQNPISASKFFVVGHAFPSAGGRADTQFSVYLDSTNVDPAISELVQSDSTTEIATRNNLVRVASPGDEDCVVFVVDESFELKFSSLTASPTQFYLVFLPNDWPVLQIWGVRDALDKNRIAYDIVHLIRSSDAADVLAALDCGLRNAKQSLLATRIGRMDAAITAEEVTQDGIDQTINDALKRIREIKRA